MGMFDDFSGVGRILLELNGDIVQLERIDGSKIFPLCVIDKSPDLQDPGRSGGQKVQTFQFMGYLDQNEVPDPKKGEKISYNGEVFLIMDPKDGGGGLWEFGLRRDFDE